MTTGETNLDEGGTYVSGECLLRRALLLLIQAEK